jgi:DNA polymerase (family 10)
MGPLQRADHDKAEKKTGEPPQLKPVASKTEADVYKKLGLAFVEPEMREDRGEVAAAEKGELPELISSRHPRRPALHRWRRRLSDDRADGRGGDRARERVPRNHRPLKEPVIANGFRRHGSLALRQGHPEVNDKYKEITLLAGCEVRLLVDGKMDLRGRVLAERLVVASPHVALKQDEQKATDRLRGRSRDRT